MGSLQYLKIYWASRSRGRGRGRGRRTWGLLGGHLLSVSDFLYLAEQGVKKKPEKMSTVGSIDLETKNIRNLNLFLQLYFAFRNINTSKCVVVLLIHGSRAIPWLWSFVVFFLWERTLHQFSTEQGWFVPFLKSVNTTVCNSSFTHPIEM